MKTLLTALILMVCASVFGAPVLLPGLRANHFNTNADPFTAKGPTTLQGVTGQGSSIFTVNGTNSKTSFVILEDGSVVVSNNTSAGFFRVDKHGTNSAVWDYGGAVNFFSTPDFKSTSTFDGIPTFNFGIKYAETNIGASTNIVIDWSGPSYIICQPSNTATISFVSSPSSVGQVIYVEMQLTNSTINLFWTGIDTRGRSPALVQGVTNLFRVQASGNTFVNDGQDVISGDKTAALVSSNTPSINFAKIVNATVSKLAAFDAQGILTNSQYSDLGAQWIASLGGFGTNLSLRPDPASAASLVLKVLGVSTSTTNELEIQNNGVTYAAWNQYGQSLGTNHADNSPPMLLIRPITTGIQMDMITGTTLPINVKATNGGRFAVQADGSLEATTNASVYNLFVTNSGTFLGGGSNSLGFTTFTGSVTDILAHLVLGTTLTTGQTNNGSFTNSTDFYNGRNSTNKGWFNLAGAGTNDGFWLHSGTVLANSNLWVQAGQSTSNAVVGGVVFKSYYATPYTNLNATISTLTNAAFWITPGNMMTNVNDGEIAVWRGGLKAGTNSLQVLFEKQVILSTGSISNSTCGFEIGYELTRINTTTLHADAWFSFQESSSGVLNVGDAGLIRTNFDFTVTGIGGAINTNLLQIASNEGIGVSNNWMKVTFEPASR